MNMINRFMDKAHLNIQLGAARLGTLGIKIPGIDLKSLPSNLYRQCDWKLSGWVVKSFEKGRRISVSIGERFWPFVDRTTFDTVTAIGMAVRNITFASIECEQDDDDAKKFTARFRPEGARILCESLPKKEIRSYVSNIIARAKREAHGDSRNEAIGYIMSDTMGNLEAMLRNMLDLSTHGLMHSIERPNFSDEPPK